MAASKTIGGINVSITASIDKFQKSMTKAQKLIKGFTSSVKRAVFSMKGLAVALTGGVAAGMMVKFTKDQFQAIDALGELSDKLGVSTDKLAGLQLAASEAGIDNALLEKSLVKLSNTMGMSGDKALRKWIEDTSKLGTQQEKLAAATEMFGTRGASMVRFLNGGTGALDEAQKAAENLGLALDAKTVKGVERAMDAFGRFKIAVSGIFRSLAAEIAPFIEVLANKASSFLASNGRGKGIGKAISDFIIKAIGAMADAGQRAFAALLDAAAGILNFINAFKSTKFAEKLGFSMPTHEERAAPWSMENKANWLRHQDNLPSSIINRAMEDARKKAAEEAKRDPSNLGAAAGNIAGKLFGDKATMAKNMGLDLWGKAQRGVQAIPGAMLGLQWKARMMAAQNFMPAMAGGGGMTPALSLAQSGSADSYRQQAAIRRQGEQIGKQQLKAQQKMVASLDRIDKKTMPLAPAGLA